MLERVAGPDVTLVDSAETVAEVVADGLAERGLAVIEAMDGLAEHHLCVTDNGESFHRLAGRILGDTTLPLEWVEVV